MVGKGQSGKSMDMARNCHFAVMRLRREKRKASRSCELVVARWFSSRVRTPASQAKPSPSPRVWLSKAFFVFFLITLLIWVLFRCFCCESLFTVSQITVTSLHVSCWQNPSYVGSVFSGAARSCECDNFRCGLGSNGQSCSGEFTIETLSTIVYTYINWLQLTHA